MRKKPGKRERVARKRKRRGSVSSNGGETLKLGSKKMSSFFLRILSCKSLEPVVDAEGMAKSCAGEHP